MFFERYPIHEVMMVTASHFILHSKKQNTFMEIIKTVCVHLMIALFFNQMSTVVDITGPVGIAGELQPT